MDVDRAVGVPAFEGEHVIGRWERSVGADGESGPFSPEPHQRAEEMEEAPRVATLTLDREARILRREGIPGLHGGEPAVGADPPLHRCSRDETISLRPGGCLGDP